MPSKNGKVLVGYSNLQPMNLEACALVEDIMLFDKSGKNKEKPKNMHEVWNLTTYF